MIYTVTLNPALDRAIEVERLLIEDTTRIENETLFAAGKGIDVSRVIRELGGQSIAAGFVGGYDGLQLEGLLINAGIITRFTRISGETRTNLILKERTANRQYVISASGPAITATEIGQLYQQMLDISDMNYMVLSGSLPRGVTSNLYGQLIMAGKRKNAFVLLDTDGKSLKDSIFYKPTAIKPNRFELSRLMGRELNSEAEILSACDQLHSSGIEYVLVSLGKDGLILSTSPKKIKGFSPPVMVDSTVGAGDSAVAGFVMALCQGKEPEECVRIACAAGTATAMTPGSELCRREDVEKMLPQITIQVI